MSIAELGMLVNDDFDTPLNIQIKNQLINDSFYSAQLITQGTTWQAPFSGTYKVICVGAGEDGHSYRGTTYGGASGGVSVSKIHFQQGDTISIDFSDGNVSFGTYATANKAGGRIGGTATAYDGVAYNGNNAQKSENSNGADVPLYDPRYVSLPYEASADASFDDNFIYYGGIGLFGGRKGAKTYSYSDRAFWAMSGAGGYGAGGSAPGYSSDYSTPEIYGSGGDACVYIELVHVD